MSAYYQQFPPDTDFWFHRQYGKVLNGSYVGGAQKCVASPNRFDEDKNSALPSCQAGGSAGNPMHIGAGRIKLIETDYVDPTGALTFQRQYWSEISLGEVLASGAIGGGARRSYVARWRHSFGAGISASSTAFVSTAWATRPDNRTVAFGLVTSNWVGESDVRDRLIELKDVGGARVGWKLLADKEARIETYSAAGALTRTDRFDGSNLQFTFSVAAGPTTPWPGLLTTVTDQNGRQLTFQYDAQGRMTKLIDPAGGEYVYAYDESSSVVLNGQRPGNNLTSITYPNGLKRIYHYNEQENTANANLPNALTGISKEIATGQYSRYATYKYDSLGRAISTERGGGVNRYSVNYTSPYQQSIVTDPLGTQRTYNFATILGVVKQTSVSQPAGAGSSACADALTYDANANIASRIDFNGVKTCYAYDLSRNLETKRVEGLSAGADCAQALSAPPASARVISTQWHPDWRFETRIAEPKKITTITYNGQGATCAPSIVLVDGKPPAVVCSRSEQATTDETGAAGFGATTTGIARTWSYTYTTYGRVLTATDPNGKTTSTTYHPDDDPDLGRRGNVATVTNAAGHVTHYTDYNAHGQPTRIVDPNGLVTLLTYDTRLRLTSRTVGGEATTFGYDPVGQLTSVTLPDGASLAYTYDAAHRLTAIQDHKGNRVVYTLDAMGNRINEQVTDPGGALVRNIQRSIDALNRVQQVVGTVQ